MAIALLRVDDRLVRGQVVEGWLPSLKAALIIVACDAAAAQALASPQMAAGRALVLVPGPGEALALLKLGVAVARVNVGGLHFTVGKVQLGRALFLDEKDKAALREIAARGVKLEGQPLPSDPEEDLAVMLRSA